MRLVKVEEAANSVKEPPSYSSMKEAEAMALRDHSMGRDDCRTHSEHSQNAEMDSPQFMNVQKVPDVVNATKNFLNSSILTSGELLVDINGDLITAGGAIPLEKYIPQQYEDDLLHDDLTEDDKRLAAALVAVQLVNQHKNQNTGTHILPMLAPAPIITNKDANTVVAKTGTTSGDTINKNHAANIATIVSNYIQAVEEDGSSVDSSTVQPLPPLKKVLSRNRYMRPHLHQLSMEEHQQHLESLGIHTETEEQIEISPEEIEIEHSEDIKSEISDYVIQDVATIKTEEVQYLLEEEDEQDSDNEALDSDYDNINDNQQSRKSLPHKKRIPRKLKHPKKTSSNHNSKVLKCMLCPETFTSQTALLDHRVTHLMKNNQVQVLPSSSFSCELCYKSFSNQWKFFEHLKQHYEPLQLENSTHFSKKTVSTGGSSKTIVCEVDIKREHKAGKATKTQTGSQMNRWFTSQQLQDVTITQTSQNNTAEVMQTMWECQPCKRIFRRQKTYETHMSVAHPKEEEIEEFSDPEDMMAGIKVQVQSDDDKDQSSDREMNKEWFREDEVRAAEADLLQMQGEKNYNACEICNQVYSSKVHLNQHISSQHSDIMTAITKTVRRSADNSAKAGKLGCKQCGRLFHHRNSLLYHLKSHLGERPHQCEVCGKGFFATNALKVHMRQHSGVKPFKCEFCGRNFRQWGDLKYHCISIHSNEKNFQCEYCGKDFARKYSLTLHSTIHTGERNYKCDYCDKSFRASTYLQNHRRIHTGEKPHPCDICGKPFRVRSDMKRHMMTHSKEPYTSYFSKTKIEPGTSSSSSDGNKLVVQVPGQQSVTKVIEDMHVTTVESVESVLSDETTAASTRLQEELTYSTTREPLDKEANTVYVWPIYM